MTNPSHISRRTFLGLAGAGASAALLGACGSGSGSGDKNGKQTINWWHIGTTPPLSVTWPALAKSYMDKHPNVTIKLTAIENDAFKAKLTPAIQAGSPPDLFHSWGGGTLKDQVDAGMVKDITNDVADIAGTMNQFALSLYKVNGKVFGLPLDLGMVGFWYNKDLFSRAGITTVPSTWSAFLDTVRKLKAANITPLALAGADKWPEHYYWAYLAMRVGGIDALNTAVKNKNFNTPELVAAGQHLKELVDLKPFQNGFLGAKYNEPNGQAATMGNGKAAMELMGQWGPSVEAASSSDQKGQGDKLAFFPFPSVEGGKGAVTEAFGGGNGYAIGKNAPPATVDFLKFLASPDSQKIEGATNAILPVVKGTETSVTDPMQILVAKSLTESTGFQLYLDQAYAPAIGQQVNDSVSDLMAGKASPEQVCKAITNAAAQ